METLHITEKKAVLVIEAGDATGGACGVAFGSPTFFMGSEIYFGKDRLRELDGGIATAAAPQP